MRMDGMAYRRNIERHILPRLGRMGLRRLRPHHLEALYAKPLYPTDGTRGLAPKTAYEVHLVIRGALGDAVRRGLISRNVALVAYAPRLRSIPKVEQQAWTAPELQQFLRAAAGHRHLPALWVAAFTGMRRNELLGPRRCDRRAQRQDARRHAPRPRAPSRRRASGAALDPSPGRCGRR